jgi:hypothetical protein
MTDAAHQKDEDAEAEISNSFKRHQYIPKQLQELAFDRVKAPGFDAVINQFLKLFGYSFTIDLKPMKRDRF